MQKRVHTERGDMEKNYDKTQKEPQLVIPYGYMPYNQPEEDEIDLRELWRTLKKRKMTVIATTAIVFAIALAYIFLAKPLYEAKATLEIGKELAKNKDGVLVTKYFNNSRSLKEYLDVKYDTAGKYRDKNTTAYISNVSIPKKGGAASFITVTAIGGNNIDAVNMLKKPIDEIKTKHQAYFDTVVKMKKDAIDNLEHQISYYKNSLLPNLKENLKILQKSLKEINEKISFTTNVELKKIENKIAENNERLQKLQDRIKQKEIEILKKELLPASKMSTASEEDIIGKKIEIASLKSEIDSINNFIIPDLEKQKTRILQEIIPNLEAEKRRLLEEAIPQKKVDIKKLLAITIPQMRMEINQIRTSMEEPYLVMTHIVGKIYTHDDPVKPKKKLVLAVAIVTGLFLGIFLAFFLEFIARNENREQ